MMPIEKNGRLEAGAERRMNRHKGGSLSHFFRVLSRMALENVAPRDRVGEFIDDRPAAGRDGRGTDDEDLLWPETMFRKILNRRIGVGLRCIQARDRVCHCALLKFRHSSCAGGAFVHWTAHA